MSVLFSLRITGVTTSGTCTVDVVDNAWYEIFSPDDHWVMTSGSIRGVTATSGSYGRFHNLLNLHDLARLEGWREPAFRGSKGAGLSHGGGVVEWEVI